MAAVASTITPFEQHGLNLSYATRHPWQPPNPFKHAFLDQEFAPSLAADVARAFRRATRPKSAPISYSAVTFAIVVDIDGKIVIDDDGKPRFRQIYSPREPHGMNIDEIKEVPELPDDCRQCNICPRPDGEPGPIVFTSYVMQISHFQGNKHKARKEVWDAGEIDRELKKWCPPASEPAFKCDLCGIDSFPSSVQLKSHKKGKLHKDNVKRVEQGLSPRKRKPKKDNCDYAYRASFYTKYPQQVQDEALPGGCLEKALRKFKYEQEAHCTAPRRSAPKRTPTRTAKHTTRKPPITNNTMFRPPIDNYESSSGSSPSPAYSGGDQFQAPQSSPGSHVRVQFQPQNRTLSSSEHAYYQQHANSMEPNTLYLPTPSISGPYYQQPYADVDVPVLDVDLTQPERTEWLKVANFEVPKQCKLPIRRGHSLGKICFSCKLKDGRCQHNHGSSVSEAGHGDRRDGQRQWNEWM